MASVGHVCWQAVLISPSRTGRFSFSAVILTSLMRCTQNVHFSMTPRERTVTSGLRCILMVRFSLSAYCTKLNRRTLYGQLLEQYRVPMQRL